MNRKTVCLILAIILAALLLTGCVSSKDIIVGGTMTKNIHAQIRNFLGECYEVEVLNYSTGTHTVIIHTTDGRKIITSYENVIIIEQVD